MPEAEAFELAAAFADGPIRCSIGRYGRGERDSPSLTHVRPRPSLKLVNRTPATQVMLATARSA